MNSTNRLIVNTFAQHCRTVLHIAMSLYSTRLVLDALGKSSYGVYMLIGGIVSLLMYITNSMVITTQRHLSYSYGQKEYGKASIFFHNSYILHCIMGLAISMIFLILTPYLFNGHTLNISSDIITEAEYVYFLVIISVFLTFISSPFRATLIAHENIVYISIIDILDGALKLGLVFILYFVTDYKLTIYAAIMASVMVFNLLALSIYCKLKYKECGMLPNIALFEKTAQKKLIGFATWTLYGTMCIFLRAQGIAVILNRYFGVIANTAYGIANQVFGSIQFLSQSILNAIAPQIIKAEGESNRERMVYLSLQACKYCFLLLSIAAIPLIFEMNSILKIWLGSVPEYTVLLCRMLMIASLIDQVTIGLNTSIQAMGNIRNYTFLIYTIKVLTLPLFWFVLKMDCPIEYAMTVYIILELASSMARLPYIMRKTDITTSQFYNNVLRRIILPCLAMVVTCYIMCMLPDFILRFILTGMVNVLIGIAAIWFLGLDEKERVYIVNIVKRIKTRNK